MIRRPMKHLRLAVAAMIVCASAAAIAYEDHLPPGPEAARLRDRWDAPYRNNNRPGWDTGYPSTELTKAVNEGEVKPGRAIELGCGTGSNAIYLAQQGFDVTAVDVSPTALERAEEKAQQAGVKIRFLLADVLKLPDLEPFDFIFDRGCYHGVRRSHAAGYVEAVTRLSKPGTRLLIVAGNANESRQSGPPRVKEEELRGDLQPGFNFVRLRETRFDSAAEPASGALAWSALLERKTP